MDSMWAYEVALTASDQANASAAWEFDFPSSSAIAQVTLSQHAASGDPLNTISGHITAVTAHGKKHYFSEYEAHPCMVAKEKFTSFATDFEAHSCDANWIVNIFFWHDVQFYATSHMVVAV